MPGIASSPFAASCRRSASGKRGEAKSADRACYTLYHGRVFRVQSEWACLLPGILQMLFGDSSSLRQECCRPVPWPSFFFLSTLSNGLLQGMNRMKEPIKNAVIALGASHDHSGEALMLELDLNIFAVIIANGCFRTDHVYSKYFDPPLQRIPSGSAAHVFVPAVSAAGMGVVVAALLLPSASICSFEQSDRNARVDCCRRLYLRDAAFDAYDHLSRKSCAPERQNAL